MAEAHKKTAKKSETAKTKAAPRARKEKATIGKEREAVEVQPAPESKAEGKKLTVAPRPPAEKRELAAPSAKRLLPTGIKYYGTGRRKEAVARVWLSAGKGRILVNAKPFQEYFCHRRILEFSVQRPLKTTSNSDKFDVYAFVAGGGVPGQAGAVSLGIARALLQVNPDLKTALKREGLLTRDPRMKERKKYGLKRARRAFQFTKR
jgi:small subunit ribosomal protein S9